MVILCHYTLSLQPLSPPPSEVCSDVFMCTEYIKKKNPPSITKQTLCSALCDAGSFFRVAWLLLLREAELINVWSHDTQFFCPFNLFTGHAAHLDPAFPSLGICNINSFIKYQEFHYDLIHLSGQVARALDKICVYRADSNGSFSWQQSCPEGQLGEKRLSAGGLKFLDKCKPRWIHSHFLLWAN